MSLAQFDERGFQLLSDNRRVWKTVRCCERKRHDFRLCNNFHNSCDINDGTTPTSKMLSNKPGICTVDYLYKTGRKYNIELNPCIYGDKCINIHPDTSKLDLDIFERLFSINSIISSLMENLLHTYELSLYSEKNKFILDDKMNKIKELKKLINKRVRNDDLTHHTDINEIYFFIVESLEKTSLLFLKGGVINIFKLITKLV